MRLFLRGHLRSVVRNRLERDKPLMGDGMEALPRPRRFFPARESPSSSPVREYLPTRTMKLSSSVTFTRQRFLSLAETQRRGDSTGPLRFPVRFPIPPFGEESAIMIDTRNQLDTPNRLYSLLSTYTAPSAAPRETSRRGCKDERKRK